ncbi:signal transduction histidine kinase [Phyllobacterium endophyticum]|nr:signal transduction histidine kinase [Phyllobacterium endophyticum]
MVREREHDRNPGIKDKEQQTLTIVPAPFEKTGERAMNLLGRWNSQSLAKQFLLTGGLVSLGAMILTGIFVTTLIEGAVTRNSAAATALYVDSVVAPILPDMQTNQILDDTVTRALDETLGQGALASRLMSFRLWRSDGTILYSSEKALVGKRFPVSEDLKAAFDGRMVANFGKVEDLESETERASGKPLLEIYNPVLQPWSGKVVAVSEFYEIADEFQHSLDQARLLSWLAVASFTLAFFLVLSFIVVRGSKTIDRQGKALKQRVSELSDLLAQNKALHAHVQRASQRASALNENYLRRIGADLHDGPAQLLAFAALRLDSDTLVNPAVPGETREHEVMAIKESLDEAMREIRSICEGLVLPHIEAADLSEIVQRAVRAHQYHTGTSVELTMAGSAPELGPSAKICIYRFVQEALNNSFRHAGGIRQRVVQSVQGQRMVIEVFDGGPGFDPEIIGRTSIGLAGLRDRVESLGGRFAVESSRSGTRVTMSLNMNGMEHA